MTERGALLGVPVDPPLHRVDIDERQLTGARQQRHHAGQLCQEIPARSLQLAHVAPGERAQERAQRGRRPHPAEQAGHRAVTQQAQVVDRVRARGHPRHQAGHLHLRARPGPRRDPDTPADQGMQPSALGQRHQRNQPGP